MWQDRLLHYAVFTKASEEFAPHYLAEIRHDMRQTTVTYGLPKNLGRMCDKNTAIFAGFHGPVALHLTVVWMGCDKNREPAILLLAYVNAKQGGQAWTPPQHSAPIWRALPEAKPAKATSASTRAKTSDSCVPRAIRRSAPRKAPRCTACARRPRPSPAWGRCSPTAVRRQLSSWRLAST